MKRLLLPISPLADLWLLAGLRPRVMAAPRGSTTWSKSWRPHTFTDYGFAEQARRRAAQKRARRNAHRARTWTGARIIGAATADDVVRAIEMAL